jgi:hypothetical protein
MTDPTFDKLIAQLSRSTSDETFADIVPIDSFIPDISYYHNGLEKDNPFIVLKNSDITEEQAITIIRKVSEFTKSTSTLETIYKGKVGQGLSHKDACVATVDLLADLLAQRV